MNKIHPQLRIACQIISNQLDPRAVAGDGWSGIVAQALEHGLGPMLIWCIEAARLDSKSNPDWLPLLEARRVGAMQFMLLEAAQREYDQSLQAAGIPRIWLKGIALAATLYPQPELRPMSDMDVLVPYEERLIAVERAAALGYSRQDGDGDSALLFVSPHHYVMAHKRVILEIHYWLIAYQLGSLSQTSVATRFFEDALSTRQPDSSAYVMRPEAQVLSLSAHAIFQHKEHELYALRYLDLHRVIERHAPDWDIVIAQAAEFGWAYAVERSLQMSVDLFGTGIPQAVFEGLAQQNHLTFFGQDKGQRVERFLQMIRSYTPKQTAWLILRLVCPPRAYIRTQYRIPPGRPVLLYYVRYWARQASEVFLAIWNRLFK
jgi:hypothetical protein